MSKDPPTYQVSTIVLVRAPSSREPGRARGLQTDRDIRVDDPSRFQNTTRFAHFLTHHSTLTYCGRRQTTSSRTDDERRAYGRDHFLRPQCCHSVRMGDEICIGRGPFGAWPIEYISVPETGIGLAPQSQEQCEQHDHTATFVIPVICCQLSSFHG